MKTIRLARSVVGRREADAVTNVLIDDGYLGMGSEVQRFEIDLAEFLGVSAKNVVCVNSGTSAVMLAAQAVLDPGDEVLVQSLTFVATFQALQASRIIPVACEVLPQTATIDLEDAARRITPRTRAIMPVHYASNPGNLDSIYEFAAVHGLRVIEDAAHAFGCMYRGRLIGSFGDIQCFSFDGIKNITSGEGGAIISADPKVLELVRDARLLGVERDTERRFTGQRSWDFDVKHLGYRCHLSNLLAAIGRTQLKRFPLGFAPKRVALAKLYREMLAASPGLVLFESELGPIVPHIQPVRVLNGLRDKLRLHLQEVGVETGIHYKPNHLLTLFGGGKISLPVTEQIYSELLSLPLHPDLQLDDVAHVCNAIRNFYQKMNQ
jgi:dTDP-4-amino-4,6-dideoxygalactose transaminase